MIQKPVRRRVHATVAMIVCAMAGAATAQRPFEPLTSSAREWTVIGRVRAADNGQVLRRVRVALSASTASRPVFTDDDGRFILPATEADIVSITAAKAGYATLTRTVSRAEGGNEVELRLERGAAITGRVVDREGTPIVEALVAVRRVGERGGDVTTATTNDLGEYRIGGLPAGRYSLQTASPVNLPSAVTSSTAVLPTTALQDSGQTVEVRVGEEVTVDAIALPDPVPGPGFVGVCPVPGSATIRVPVVTTRGERLRGAAVTLSGGSQGSPRVASGPTDARGLATFPCLSAGDYTITVGKRGFTLERYGEVRARRFTLAVREGQVQESPIAVMSPGARLIGTIVDELGEPLEGVTVQALQLKYVEGRMQAVPAGVAQRSDDRGAFRVYGVARGSYLLEATTGATLSGGGPRSYTPVYFPGSPEIATANEVIVAADQELNGLTIVFQPSPAVSVGGRIVDSAGAPVEGIVRLTASARSGSIGRQPAQARADGRGEFLFQNVAPGEYVVHAVKPSIFGGTTEAGSAYVTVAASNPAPVVVRTSPGVTVEGRVTVEGGDRRGLQLAMVPADSDRAASGASGRGAVLIEDTFYVNGVYVPSRFALTAGPPDSYLKAVTQDGLDITDATFDPHAPGAQGLDVVVAGTGAALTGRLTRSRRDGYLALVFSVHPDLWWVRSRHIKADSSSQDGTYTVSGLPPGQYWAVAIDSPEPAADDAWRDPVLLEKLATRAARVSLAEGERRTLNLTLVGLPN